MSYRVKIILDFEEKPTPKDIIDYVAELGVDIDFKIETKTDVPSDDTSFATLSSLEAKLTQMEIADDQNY